MVVLRPLRLEDMGGMLEWMRDKDTQQFFQSPMGERTEKDVADFIRGAKSEPEDGGSVHLAVVDAMDEYLGTVSLKNYTGRDRNAEFAISLRPGIRGRGIGEEATKALLRLAFDKWNLERVYLSVLPENIRAIRLYERCGFTCEGEFLRHLYIHGEYRDLRWYGMVKEKYEEIKLCTSGGGKYWLVRSICLYIPGLIMDVQKGSLPGMFPEGQVA